MKVTQDGPLPPKETPVTQQPRSPAARLDGGSALGGHEDRPTRGLTRHTVRGSRDVTPEARFAPGRPSSLLQGHRGGVRLFCFLGLETLRGDLQTPVTAR